MDIRLQQEVRPHGWGEVELCLEQQSRTTQDAYMEVGGRKRQEYVFERKNDPLILP